ncbi:MAG: septal ring lytic transglycosylase RlpA family protein [Aphanothece sp. CMT-3BRIN-NPC111]|jgi:rare lipoprotein A|nr:septal ring lytic transglycosylase RlpA family protein [Aphanothece sp. CMT-3BRIN-NPC111]
MNQIFWSGLITGLVTTILGTTSSTNAQQTQAVTQGGELKLVATQMLRQPIRSLPVAPRERVAQAKIASTPALTLSSVQPSEGVIAKILPHELAGRKAVTLYVRSIPILTFLGSDPLAAKNSQLLEAGGSIPPWHKQSEPDAPQDYSAASAVNNFQDDPVLRATAVAAKLNKLNGDKLDAKAIAVTWNTASNSATIKVNGEALVDIDANTRLPDTTKNIAEDALQATNRLRRLMGNAPPLREIAGRPQRQPPKISKIPLKPLVRSQSSGIASWYGSGFNGNRSASGEIFNQNAMTAAHRSLPFGTRVRVTNLNNNRSVVVRINDRGPFIRGRVIDLSAAAARVLGMTNTGVAPVRLEVLGSRQTASASQ